MPLDACNGAAPVPAPGSITWQRASDARVLSAAGYALLLQVSHPTVGAGVTEHSQFRRDPWGRLLRTLDYACAMAYGGEPAAREMGRRIRAMHARIRGVRADGRPYDALEPEAYAWVHATLAAGIVAAHERFGRRLRCVEREQLWSEWLALGELLEIGASDLPQDWRAFEAYFEAMVHERLEHTAAVEEVLETLTRPAPPALAALYRPVWSLVRMPLSRFVGLVTTGLLPPSLRERLGLQWDARRSAQLALLGVSLRAATPLMPQTLLVTGPGYLRWREQAIAPATPAGSSSGSPWPPSRSR